MIVLYMLQILGYTISDVTMTLPIVKNCVNQKKYIELDCLVSNRLAMSREYALVLLDGRALIIEPTPSVNSSTLNNSLLVSLYEVKSFAWWEAYCWQFVFNTWQVWVCDCCWISTIVKEKLAVHREVWYQSVNYVLKRIILLENAHA